MAFTLILCITLSLLHTVYTQNTLLKAGEEQPYIGAPCRMDSGIGECVFLYLCNTTTNTIIEDGSEVFNPRVNEAPIDCPLPLICCGSENNTEDQGAKHTTPPINARNSTLGKLDKVKQSVGAPCRMDTGLGECVHLYLCNITTNIIIEDGGTIFDPRVNETPIDCPIPLICCGSENNTVDQGNQGSKTRNIKPPIGSCGWRNPDGMNTTRTVKAYQAKRGEFPWLINVVKFIDQSVTTFRSKYIGDGALIHNRAVLSAAHILLDYDVTVLRVVAGEYEMSPEPVAPRLVRMVKTVKTHPDYEKATLRNDFALLFLQSEIEFGANIAPICLASPTTEVSVGTRCIAAGWGKDRRGVEQTIPAMVELPIVEHEVCQMRQRTTNAGLYFNLHESFICAGGEIGPDTCRGSGGAPLVCPIESQPGRYAAVGVTSWDMLCGANGVPAVYAKIAYARAWIDRTMAEEGLGNDLYSV